MEIVTNGPNYTVECKYLENVRSITVLNKGREVGTVSATFDLTNLPPLFRPYVAGMCLQQNKLYCNVPTTKEEALEEMQRLERQRAYLERLDRSFWSLAFDWCWGWLVTLGRKLWRRSKS